jgi:hypothetical protein
MRFHFFIGNHEIDGRGSVLDLLPWLAGGLVRLKHEITIGENLSTTAINIIFENFADTDIHALQNCKFGLVATEIPTNDSFNEFMWEPWLARRRCFDKIAPAARFIWSFVQQPIESYSQWAPSGYLELGFLESIVDPVFLSEPEFDFGFYGLHNSPYRRAVLEHLGKYFAIAVPRDFLIGSELNRFIASFKVGICLKHSPTWPVPSPGRIGRLLHARRGIAAEYVPVRTRASALVPMAREGQDFAEFCLQCIEGPWKKRADDAFERFRDTMPMETILERLLDETVARS